jgi:2-isopropylmalate synthase
VGVPESRLVLGKHSGRHALKSRLEVLGFVLTREELDVVYTEITALADNKKGLMDEEIAELARRSRQAFAQTS